jgi:hypothetical protein
MIAARAARLSHNDDPRSKKHIAADVVAEYLIGALHMAMIYVSPDPYGSAFEEELDLHKLTLRCIVVRVCASLRRTDVSSWH